MSNRLSSCSYPMLSAKLALVTGFPGLPGIVTRKATVHVGLPWDLLTRSLTVVHVTLHGYG
jgi:hypothetical protein